MAQISKVFPERPIPACAIIPSSFSLQKFFVSDNDQKISTTLYYLNFTYSIFNHLKQTYDEKKQARSICNSFVTIVVFLALEFCPGQFGTGNCEG